MKRKLADPDYYCIGCKRDPIVGWVRQYPRVGEVPWYCGSCHAVNRLENHREVPITGVPRGVISYLDEPELGLIHEDLIRALGVDRVHAHLSLRPVLNMRGKVVVGWSSFVGRYRTIVRGTAHAGVRACEECGNPLYFAMPPDYLHPRPEAGVDILDAGAGRLVIPKDLFEGIHVEGWKGLACTPLPVLDPPPDGLGLLPYPSW